MAHDQIMYPYNISEDPLTGVVLDFYIDVI